LKLSYRDFLLLKVLLRFPETIISYDKMIVVLERNVDSITRATVNARVCRLRRVLAQAGLGQFIRTVPGVGCLLRSDVRQ
jgi:DNA-binding winged helix-turn-helix (wHTH) protein